jgi:hypothetical protein
MERLYLLWQISRIVTSISLVSLSRFLDVSRGESRSRVQKEISRGDEEGRKGKGEEAETETYQKRESGLQPKTCFYRI